jgi:hypothetical protein
LLEIEHLVPAGVQPVGHCGAELAAELCGEEHQAARRERDRYTDGSLSGICSQSEAKKENVSDG